MAEARRPVGEPVHNLDEKIMIWIMVLAEKVKGNFQVLIIF